MKCWQNSLLSRSMSMAKCNISKILAWIQWNPEICPQTNNYECLKTKNIMNTVLRERIIHQVSITVNKEINISMSDSKWIRTEFEQKINHKKQIIFSKESPFIKILTIRKLPDKKITFKDSMENSKKYGTKFIMNVKHLRIKF